jgi:hypothetical protein
MEGAQTVEKFVSLLLFSGHIFVKERSVLNIILSKCRATDRLHSRILHKTSHVTLNKHTFLCMLLVLCKLSQNNKCLFMVICSACWIRNAQSVSLFQISSNTRIMIKNNIVFNV